MRCKIHPPDPTRVLRMCERQSFQVRYQVTNSANSNNLWKPYAHNTYLLVSIICHGALEILHNNGFQQSRVEPRRQEAMAMALCAPLN